MRVERFWLCWSFSQACPHIESEVVGIETNLQAFLNNRPVDYVPIGVFESEEAAARFADAVHHRFNQRHHAHAAPEGKTNA